MAKSPDAFRTISEVADWLGVQAHVLRFWESKFSQVKPIKRAGGRRYYRPTDMLLLGGIKKLLHDDGMTIKGAQKLLREKGNAFVADLSQPLDDLTVAVIEGTAEDVTDKIEAQTSEPPKAIEEDTPDEGQSEVILEADTEALTADGADGPANQKADEPDSPAEDSEAASQDIETSDAEEEDVPVMPSFRAHARGGKETADTPAPSETTVNTDDADDAPTTPEKFEVSPPEPKETPKPRIIDVGPLPDLADFPDEPSVLSSLSRISSLSAKDAAEIQPLLARLTRLRASMGSTSEDAGKD